MKSFVQFCPLSARVDVIIDVALRRLFCLRLRFVSVGGGGWIENLKCSVDHHIVSWVKLRDSQTNAATRRHDIWWAVKPSNESPSSSFTSFTAQWWMKSLFEFTEHWFVVGSLELVRSDYKLFHMLTMCPQLIASFWENGISSSWYSLVFPQFVIHFEKGNNVVFLEE